MREARDLSRAQPWALLTLVAFPLSFAWEMLQAPLYRGMLDLSRAEATWRCALASVGDVAIMLVAYAVVALVVSDRVWLLRSRPGRDLALDICLGLIATIVLEILNVRVWARWSYGPRMPRIGTIGVAPLAQWAVVPLAALWLVRLRLITIARRARGAGLESG